MAGTKSIDELRELAADINSTEIIDHLDVVGKFMFRSEWLDSWHKAFDVACDEIEREIAERYMELPVDADGEVIRVGDVVEFGEYRNMGIAKAVNERMVIAMRIDDTCTNYAKYGLLWDADSCRHVKPRTIEDVLLLFKDDCKKIEDCPFAIDYMPTVKRYADEIRGLL